MKNNISNRIKEAMESSGLTLMQLQEMTGIPKSAIQRYASGDTDKLPIDRIKELATAMNVSSSYIMGWDESNEKGSIIKDLDLARWLGDLLNNDDSAVHELLKIISTLEDDDLKTLLVMAKALKK